mmetsp:Transcript_41471/g.71940  ORF Transcript_41471/g.71940 Transcript_41471/m.71940 type:complete len:223 (+) Transcript_41471:536-1204(+)
MAPDWKGDTCAARFIFPSFSHTSVTCVREIVASRCVTEASASNSLVLRVLVCSTCLSASCSAFPSDRWVPAAAPAARITPASGKASLTFTSKPLPKRAFKCCAGPKQRNRPFTMTPIREQRASASSIECVVRITLQAASSAVIRAITFHMNRLATGSMPVLGSSRNTIEGSPTVATATLSLRLFPPERLPAVLCSKSFKSSCTNLPRTMASRPAPRKPLILP